MGIFTSEPPHSSRRVPDRSLSRGRITPRSSGALSPTVPSSLTPSTSNVGSSRRVSAAPPSAGFEPPTPPSEVLTELVDPSASTVTSAPIVTHAVKTPKRRHRFRYTSSSDSSSSSDEEEDSEEEEAPWWAFTQKGVHKLRTIGERGSRPSSTKASPAPNHDPPTEAESSRENMRDGRKGNSMPSVSRSMTGDMNNANSTLAPRPMTPRVAAPNPRANLGILHPRPFRTQSGRNVFRRASGQDISHSALGVTGLGSPLALAEGPARDPTVAPAMTRSNSAPSSPIVDSPTMGVMSLINTPPPHVVADSTPHSFPSRHFSRRRGLTAPSDNLKRRMADGTTDSLTDSEATMMASPRLRAKQRLFALGPPLREVSDADETALDGTTTTIRPKARRVNSHNLRIRLPPPLTQHFANGWPHAGSWQDALYGTYGDNGDESGRLGSLRESPAHEGVATIKSSRDLSGDEITGRRTNGSPHKQIVRRESSDAGPSSPPRAKRKQRNRRQRRYRTVLVPPTPGGLGFVPTEKDGQMPHSGWGLKNGTSTGAQAIPAVERDPSNPFDRIVEEDLTRQITGVTEKGKAPSPTPSKWFCWPMSRRRRTVVDDLDWRARARRALFLDARVTIYIRLVNLAITALLLGLSVTIRDELIEIGLPGLIGSSTTLIIAYSSLTIVHVLTAIYREYFGRPIGLWGLRSKMLWVCLDLLFVALWSSALSLAVNDYIDTPLDCSSATPWWADVVDYYDLVTGSIPASILGSGLARDVCRRQVALFSVSLVVLLLYCGNMVLSLFRIFETVRRAANADRAVMV